MTTNVGNSSLMWVCPHFMTQCYCIVLTAMYAGFESGFIIVLRFISVHFIPWKRGLMLV